MARKQSEHLRYVSNVRYALIAFSLVGLILSVYLLYEHFQPAPSFCDINSKVSCEAVNTSSYSSFLGIPVALFGALHYLFLFFVVLLSGPIARLLGVDRRTVSALLLIELVLAFLFSAYLTGIEAFALKTFCILCLLSAAITTASLVLAILFWRSSDGKE
jgi:uncharacterized membrane protein